jgi:cell division protease FtsH
MLPPAMKKKSSAKAESKRKPGVTTVASILRDHFRISELHKLVTASRSFPVTARIDLQFALADMIAKECKVAHQSGVQAGYAYQTFTFGMLSLDRDHAPVISPLEFEDVDIGEAHPVRCLKSTLWLCRTSAVRVAVLLTPMLKHAEASGWQVEIASLPQAGGGDPCGDMLARLDLAISRAGSYRGKVISLERRDDYSGKAGSVRVHKLRTVDREQVILPEETLLLLERNLMEFIEQRERLKDLGMSIKKGLLFHGPPGTGKTHTIHYLASRLPDHTTLLITAEQVGMLDEYMQLARFLQPAMIVLEDVDLIARERGSMRNACEESLLNKLLNEMDGLREDAALLFVLTTNRPDLLEAALASRPGRIDQAIGFPLPDDDGRRKLVRLYAGGMQITGEVAALIVRKTHNASAAFIKELMRRSAQFMLRSGNPLQPGPADVEAALDEMLLSGGSLNIKLLGGALE